MSDPQIRIQTNTGTSRQEIAALTRDLDQAAQRANALRQSMRDALPEGSFGQRVATGIGTGVRVLRGDGQGSDRGSRLARGAQSVGSALGVMSAGSLFGSNVFGAYEGIQQNAAFERQSRSMLRATQDADKLAGSLNKVATQYGLSYQQATQFYQQIGKTGAAGTPQQLQRNFAAVGANNFTGLMSPDNAQNLLASALRMGGQNVDLTRLQALAGLSTLRGGTDNMQRNEENTQAIQRLTEVITQQGGYQLGGFGQNFGGMSSLMASLNASGVYGLKDQMGADQLGQLNSAITGGQGVSKAALIMAMQKQGIPITPGNLAQYQQQGLTPQMAPGIAQSIIGIAGGNADMEKYLAAGMGLNAANAPQLLQTLAGANPQAMQQQLGNIDLSKIDPSQLPDLLQAVQNGDQSAIQRIVSNPTTQKGTFQDYQANMQGMVNDFIDSGKRLAATMDSVTDAMRKANDGMSNLLAVVNNPIGAKLASGGLSALTIGGSVAGIANLLGGAGLLGRLAVGGLGLGGVGAAGASGVSGVGLSESAAATLAANSSAAAAGTTAASGGTLAAVASSPLAVAGLGIGALHEAGTFMKGLGLDQKSLTQHIIAPDGQLIKNWQDADAVFQQMYAAAGSDQDRQSVIKQWQQGYKNWNKKAAPAQPPWIGGQAGNGRGGGKLAPSPAAGSSAQSLASFTPIGGGGSLAYGTSSLMTKEVKADSISLAGSTDLARAFHTAIATTIDPSSIDRLSKELVQQMKSAGFGTGSFGGQVSGLIGSAAGALSAAGMPNLPTGAGVLSPQDLATGLLNAGMDPSKVPTMVAILLQENGGKIVGTSPAGAEGFAQFMPKTFQSVGGNLADLNNPDPAAVNRVFKGVVALQTQSGFGQWDPYSYVAGSGPYGEHYVGPGQGNFQAALPTATAATQAALAARAGGGGGMTNPGPPPTPIPGAGMGVGDTRTTQANGSSYDCNMYASAYFGAKQNGNTALADQTRQDMLKNGCPDPAAAGTYAPVRATFSGGTGGTGGGMLSYQNGGPLPAGQRQRMTTGGGSGGGGAQTVHVTGDVILRYPDGSSQRVQLRPDASGTYDDATRVGIASVA